MCCYGLSSSMEQNTSQYDLQVFQNAGCFGFHAVCYSPLMIIIVMQGVNTKPN